MIELVRDELIQIEGGGSGSKNGAFIAGRMLGVALGGPVAMAYYAGCDLEWW